VADWLGRAHSRDAAASATIRDLLRTGHSRTVASVSCRTDRSGAELRRLRERDLSQRARIGSTRPARRRAHAWIQRSSDVDAHTGSASAPPCAGADDQRLCRVAEGQLARLADHRRRADEEDDDLCVENGHLVRARPVGCRAVFGVVPAGVASRPTAGADVAPGMNVLAIRDLEVRRGAKPVVRGVSLDVTRGEILAVMGASGAGKTSVLRAVAGLDPIAAGSVAIDGLQLSAGPLPRGE